MASTSRFDIPRLTVGGTDLHDLVMKAVQVEEIQGLYGPFSVTERVLQRIWARGDYFSEGLKTLSGASLRVLDPGRWNFQEGPDFKEAQLEIAGQTCNGDVEIHFRPEDWLTHGHETNPNFGGVVLHVVLQKSAGQLPDCVTCHGRKPETLELLPLLNRDLEAYALDEALIELERVNELPWVEDFLGLSLQERAERLQRASQRRWVEKLSFARKRLAGSDWRTACHTAALEVLGYARNRATMHKIALEYTLEDFAAGAPIEPMFDAQQGKWRLSGLRPANHPLKRLQQYSAICRAAPDWPERLHTLLAAQPVVTAEDPRAFRRIASLAALRKRIAGDIFANQLGGTRLDTLLGDALFPLAAADGLEPVSGLWEHWYPGDLPTKLGDFLKDAGLCTAAQPRSNGTCQGALGLFLWEGEVGGS